MYTCIEVHFLAVTASKITIVTTSWDDGDVRDLRVAELLKAHDMRGTFYVPLEPFNGNPSLSNEDLRSLCVEGFEIGAHGIAHENMSAIPVERARYVARTCKAVLEDRLGQKLRMFCYPRGRYTVEVARALKEAGYEGARNVHLLETEMTSQPFELPTSAQVYPHTRTDYLRNLLRARNMARLYDYAAHLHLGNDWLAIGKQLFDRVVEHGGVWHLWGHSWEIDQLGLWDEMREMLDYVSRRDGVRYLNNAGVIPYLPASVN